MRAFGALGRPADAAPPGSLPTRRVVKARGSAPTRRRLRARRSELLVGGLLLTELAAALIVSVPVPLLDDYLARQVTERMDERMACPGSTAAPPQIKIRGGQLLPQLLGGRLSEIQLSVPDTAVGDVRHASLSASLHGVHQPLSGTPRADAVDASATINFADLPTPPSGLPPGGRPPSFGRAEDGSLTVKVIPAPEQAKNVTTVLFLKLELRGNSLTATPRRLKLFGRMLPAQKVANLAGDARSQELPHLPDGLRYVSISPQQNGLHLGLGGVVTTPLSALPARVGDQPVSYVARNGLLGISTALRLLPLVNEPLTIFTAPRLQAGKLALVPQTVEFLGATRPPDDPLAALILSQIKPEDLTRPLPALPPGVRYRSVSVDGAGVKVTVGGVTVRPFSELPPVSDGVQVTYGARDGSLTATAGGMPSRGSPSPIILFARPRIVGNTLDLAPQSIQVFGALFPAADVLSQIKVPDTRYPLQALAPGLAYTGVEVLPSGLRLLVNGKDVPLSTSLMGGTGCAPADAIVVRGDTGR
jgi:hypothetical protein